MDGDAAPRCGKVAGELFGVAEVWAAALEVGDGDAFGVGLDFGAGVGFAVANDPRSFAFRLDVVPSVFGPTEEFVFLAGCRFQSDTGGAGPASLRAMSRLVDDEDGFPPGMVKTTSNLFPCGSTRAVAPGCKWKDTIVLLLSRCTFTSEKARPRTASARGTSAGGILT
jgi:hypothetical protein